MMKLGIVGLPNVGKSTLFKALTRQQIDIANYPFCTIEPNVGVVTVPDDRLEQLARVAHSKKIVPTAIEFVDIAGLVAGAHQGEGLGNQFLAAIREVDAIVQVVRVFSDDNIIHVNGRVNPADDIATITLELAMADLTTVEKRLSTAKSQLKSGAKPELVAAVATLEKIWATLNAGQPASTVLLTDDEQLLVRDLHLLTLKPMLIVTNGDEAAASPTFPPPSGEEGGKINSFLPLACTQVKGEVGGGSVPVIFLCAKLEAELADLPADEASAMLKDLGLPESGLTKLIRGGYALLKLITFLTSGEMETRAWTITQGTKAPQAAGVIHTDFTKGFIRAEITNWQDFVAHGELGCRERGLTRTEGKEYVMRDGDVCHFRVAT